jgi:hypothetical protein
MANSKTVPYHLYPKRDKKWTPEEEEYLRQNYGKISAHETAEHLGRSRAAVGIRVIKLGIPRVKHTVSLNLAPVDASWLASAIDAEGCLYLASERRGQSRKYHSVILISNTNLDFVQHAMDLIGAGYIERIPARPSKTSNGFCRPLYNYHLKGRVVVGAVMKAILPYMIIKRERAELLIQASEIDDSRFATKRDEAKKDWALLESLWGLTQQMGKGRGKYKPTMMNPVRWVHFGA